MRNVVNAVLCALIIFNIGLAAYGASQYPYSIDELQHLHVAWQESSGLLIYRDFFEHHGPIPAAANSALLTLFGTGPSLANALALRYYSIAILACMTLLVYLLGHKALGESRPALVAAALFSSSYLAQAYLAQIRPDVLQNAFTLLAAYLLLRFTETKSTRDALAAGALCGAAMLTTVKASLAIVPLAAAMLVYWLKHRGYSLREAAKWFLAGAAAIVVAAAAVFAIAGALTEFAYYQTSLNLRIFLQPVSRYAWPQAAQFAPSEALAYLLAAIGIVVLITSKNRAATLVGVIAAFSLVNLFGLHPYYFLPLLPFAAIAAAAAVEKLKGFDSLNAAYALVLVAALAGPYVNAYWLVTSNDPAKLQGQIALSDRVVNATSRNEPVLFLWNDCGANVFNADVSYFWVNNQNMRATLTEKLGYNPFGDALVEKLKRERPTYAAVTEQEMLHTSYEVYDYVRANYEPKTYCLWVRKAQPAG